MRQIQLLEDIKHYIEHSIDVKTAILNNERLLIKIYQASQLVISSIRRRGKILIAGNGGSAADAMHMATEFVVKFYSTQTPLSAIALSADSCVISAAANDFNFEYVYSRQIEALGRENDVLIAISTSGTSKNILNAIDAAKKKHMQVIFLTSEMLGATYLQKADIALCVPSDDTPLIQEAHAMIEHLICLEVEKERVSRSEP